MWLCPNNLNATPTIDRARGLIYVIAADGKFYGLDLTTGATKFGPVQFVAPYAKDWSLNFANGIVYTAISQGCGGAPSGVSAINVRDPRAPRDSKTGDLKTRRRYLGAGRGGDWRRRQNLRLDRRRRF